MALDYLMDVVEPKSFIGRCCNKVTEKFESCCIKPCTSAMNYCKNKTIEACTCWSSDDETDRCVLKSIFKVKIFDEILNHIFVVIPFHFGRNLYLWLQQLRL